MHRSITAVLILIIVLYSSGRTYAQPSFLKKSWQESKVPERGIVILVGAGVSAVRSDVCGVWDCNDIGPSASIGALYKARTNFALSLNADYVRLGAIEKTPERNLNVAFRSEVIALTGNVVVNLLDGYAGTGRYRSLRKRFIVPYARAGAGAIYYTATSFPANKDLDESQTTYDPEREYPAFAVVIPFGGGVRFRFSDEVAIAPELIYHITTSDYLDNVGARLADPETEDHYALFLVKLMYTPIVKNNIFSRKRK